MHNLANFIGELMSFNLFDVFDIFFCSVEIYMFAILVNSSVGFDELQKTNELSRVYAEALVGICKELNIKVVDLWSALQKQTDWSNVCFT